MYLYKTTTFPHQPLRSISKVAVLHRFYCTQDDLNLLILRTFKSTFSLDAAHDRAVQKGCLEQVQKVKSQLFDGTIAVHRKIENINGSSVLCEKRIHRSACVRLNLYSMIRVFTFR